MAETLIYVGTHAIKPGMLDRARQKCEELVEHLEANHPRLIHFGCYIDDDGHELTVVQVHPDEESLVLHLQVAGERIAQAYEFLEATTEIQIYGTPSDVLVAQIRQMAGEAPVNFKTTHKGFTRLPAAA